MENETASTDVILHVDLDCFYAAVEHARLSIPIEKPLAVQQWEGLIAVNYAARAAGVFRHDRVADALRKCPGLQLVHVETVGNDHGDGATTRRDTSKVSLERYRQASRCVFDIFHHHADICERASIDEAYLDVTKKVESFMKERCNWGEELHHLLDDADGKTSMVIESASLDLCNPVNRRLLAGAIIAERIRTDVRSKLGYTCSVGIATNKLLAKIASARNKPDQQTLILPEAVSDLMDALPLKKVKLLGGKIGEELSEKWSCRTAGDAQKIPLKSLLSSYGDRLGNYVYRAIRGIHEDKVHEKQTTKSMLAAKSFVATHDITVIRMWLGVLAEELSVRILRDCKENNRQPHGLQLYYRSGIFGQSGDHSKSCPMPHNILQLLSSACFGAPRLLKHQFSDASALPSRKRNSYSPCENELEVRETNDSESTLVHNNPMVDETLEELSVCTTESGMFDGKTGTSGTPVCVTNDSESIILVHNHHTVDEALEESPVHMRESGIFESKTGTSLAPVCVTNTSCKIGPEEVTVKELSKLLLQASFQLFQRLDNAFPCTRLAIAASGFHDAPVQGSQSIQQFFGKPPMPLSNSTVKFVGEKQAKRNRGLLRYLDDGTSSKVPCVPLHENEVRDQSLQCKASEDTKSDICESLAQQNAKFLGEEARCEALMNPSLNLSKSFRCLGEQVNQQGNSTQVSVDLTNIDVSEQWRILKEIQKAKVPLEASETSLNNITSNNSEKQSMKRRKSKISDTRSGQLSLSNFFHS